MSMIRTRPDEDLSVAGYKPAVFAGGEVSGDANPLMADGTVSTQPLTVAPTSNLEAATGAFRETIGAKALRGYEFDQIPPEDGFSTLKALGDNVAQYNQDELEFLADSRSQAELAARQNQVQLTRENLAAFAAHPLTGVAASLFDVDAVIGLGVGKFAGVARSVRLAAGLAANSAVLGLAADGGHLTPLDIIGSSLGAALGAVPAVRRAATAVEDTAEVAADAARVRPVATETAEDLAKTDTSIRINPTDEATPVQTRVVPDEDYVPPTPDLTTIKPHVNVALGKGRTLQTSTQNFVRGILNVSDDLPEDVRILGTALRDSLERDGDIPLRLQATGNNRRSNVVLDPLGGVKTTMYVDGGAKVDLDSTLKGMSLYERQIALHEAAHAKTGLSIRAWERGELPDGPVKDAVTRIDQIRQEVASATAGSPLRAGSKDRGLNYALKNNHEFVSQMFNDGDVRSALQSVKVKGQGVWSDLVQRVVTAFTGKAPQESTAFSETVAAFERLLAEPGTPTIKAKPAESVPQVQSEILQAPGLKGMASNFGRSMNQAFSLYEKIKAIGPRASTLADQLVVDATGNSAQSAAHYARTAHLAANTAAAQVDTAISQALSARGWNTFSRLRNPTQFRAAQRELSQQIYAKLAENHTAYRTGGAITEHSDPVVERAVKAFAESKWAEDQLQRIKASGMVGAENIESSPYYLPRRHNGNLVNDFLRDNAQITRADITGMYASQFERMFSQSGMTPETAKRLGNQMLRNMEQRADGVQGYRQHIAGMTNDDIEFAMRNAGIGDAEIEQFLRVSDKAGEESNTVRNLRKRADFDMTADYTTKSGDLINPQMFVDKDVLGLMEGYSRNMSGRIGLARAGFPDVKSVAAAVDEAAGEAADVRAARKTLDDTVNQLLGYPTGEDVPDILRSFAVTSGAVQLANSGIFQLADSALMIKQFGVTKVMRALGSTQWGRNAMKLAQDPAYGSRLRDVLEARNVLSGRYRTVLTHLDDNTDIGSLGIAHQMVQQMGQGTRFVNGMEYVRRGQSKLVAGLVGDTIDDAIRGNAEAVSAMGRFGLDNQLLGKARAAMQKDPDLRTWPDDLRFDMETVGQNMADALVQENRLGEIPAWMQFSTLGKFILPYMTFVAGTWNKILRRTYRQDGATGVAMMAAYQLPLQVVSSVAALGINGKKQLTPEMVTANVLTQLPMMSWLGYAVNMATQGPTNSIAALGLIDKAYSATSGIVNGQADANQIIRAVPFLSIIPGMRMMGTALSDDK